MGAVDALFTDSVVRAQLIEIEDRIVERAVAVGALHIAAGELHALAAGRAEEPAARILRALQQRLFRNFLDEAGIEARVQRVRQQHVAALTVHAVVLENHLVATFGTVHVFRKQVGK